MTESLHDGSVAVVDPTGTLIASSGDIDRRFFARSSIKPFQATVAQEYGADLPPEWLAVASASHAGDPVHLAIVHQMLETVGLSDSDLQTPPDRPRGANHERVVAASQRRPLSVYHNCSGKHAGFLRACVASGWDTASYLDPAHPLQTGIRTLVADVTDQEALDVGVDGCGAPTFTVSVRTLAMAFSRLGNAERFDRVFTAMHRYPRLVSGMDVPGPEFAIHTNGVAKGGAEANLGLVVRGFGALAIKVLDGNARAIGPVVTDVLAQLGWLTPMVADSLASATAVPMSGGGAHVGTVESAVRLTRQ